MKPERYKPKLDKLFWILMSVTNIIIVIPIVVTAVLHPATLYLLVPIFAFVNYFFISPLFGYVDLGESEMLIKYGFFLKRTIPYDRIRALVLENKWYSHSIMSLKNAFEHVEIKYNRFDFTCVSVTDNAGFIVAVKERMKGRELV